MMVDIPLLVMDQWNCPKTLSVFLTMRSFAQYVIVLLYLWGEILTLHLFNLKLKCLLQCEGALGVVT